MRLPVLCVTFLVASVCLVPPPSARSQVAERAARQIVIAIATPRGSSGAEVRAAREARAARVATRLAALGLARFGTLSDALPALAGAGARALATRDEDVAGVRPNPFGLDPSRVMLAEAPDVETASSALAALATDHDIEWAEPNQVRSLQGWIEDPARMAAATPASGAQPADRTRRADVRAARPTGGGLPPDPSSPIPPFPDDPLFRDGWQYALFNSGDSSPLKGTPRADIRAPEAWRITTGGNDVILAIADTGIDPGHPDLAGLMPDGRPRLLDPINITGLESADAYADSFAHGTVVTGTMAARTNNGASLDTFGVAGVCGGDGALNAGCRIVPIKIAPGRQGDATSFDIAHALLYATAEGARAMNLSFAGFSPSRVERLAMYEAITHGCVLVAASGNSGFTAGTLALYPSAYAADGLCIQVGASDWNDRRAVFSSYGPGLDLLAPGVNVYSTFMTYPSAAGVSYPGYVAASGTSLAAPHVAGALGLLAATRPELIENDLQHVIRESADDIGDPGVDQKTGWGRLNLARALDAVNPSLGVWHDEAPGTPGAVVATDTLWVGESGPGVMDVARVWSKAEQIEVTATIALPDSFMPPVRVWPRVGGTFTVRGGFRLPYFAPWAQVIAQDSRAFTLRGYIYRRTDACQDCDEYLPLPPDQARFGFTVIGRVDRPPVLTLRTPAPSMRLSPGDTLRLSFDASDPDTLTSIRVRLESDHLPPIPLATLPGDARTAEIVVPCLGEADSRASIQIEARDDHGPQFDRSQIAVPIDVRGSHCLEALPRSLAVAPNPARGLTRIEGPGGARVAILDLAGRRVREATLDPSSGTWTWDGLDSSGARAPAGIYFVRMALGRGTVERKVVRLE
ncbi:MAG: S8 family serine peptidase [Candidatus Eisenbacteria bacterium]|nr:S8 family serine peptidase [Candidatus Eisenbacteria bacterium]